MREAGTHGPACDANRVIPLNSCAELAARARHRRPCIGYPVADHNGSVRVAPDEGSLPNHLKAFPPDGPCRIGTRESSGARVMHGAHISYFSAQHIPAQRGATGPAGPGMAL